MDVRVEMYRILLDCINSPDLTMHFRLGLIMIEYFRMGFRTLQSQSQFDL